MAEKEPEIQRTSILLHDIPRCLLLAVVHMALQLLLPQLLPFSQSYREAMAGFVMPLWGYAVFLGIGLLTSVTATIWLRPYRVRGIRLFLSFITAFFLLQVCLPRFDSLWSQSEAGALSLWDTLMTQAGGFAAMLLFVPLCFLCVVRGPDATAKNGRTAREKFQIHIIKVPVCVFTCMILYLLFFFPSWYYLFWNNEAVRVFYTGAAETPGIMGELVKLLLGNAVHIPIQMVKGLVYTLCGVLLLFHFPGRRWRYVFSLMLLALSGALSLLVPTPFIPDAVRLQLVIERSVLLTVFAIIMGLMLYSSYQRVAVQVAEPEARKRPAAKRAPAEAGKAKQQKAINV